MIVIWQDRRELAVTIATLPASRPGLLSSLKGFTR
jgi:hypothetical protein